MAGLFDLSGRVCLVTGGTSGIGRELALGLAGAGARVTVGSTNPDKVAAAAAELGEGHTGVRLDVGDEASVRAAVDEVVGEHGRLDAVVNAAGTTHRAPSTEVSLEDWERVIRVNLTGTFLTCREAGRAMVAQEPRENGERGCIVNIASIGTFVALPDTAAYVSSKAGVGGLTRLLANDWAKEGVRVNAIAPGVFPTDLNRALIQGTPRGEELLFRTPMRRFGRLEELVGAAIYLCSDAASFTTGHILAVDGGFLARGVES